MPITLIARILAIGCFLLPIFSADDSAPSAVKTLQVHSGKRYLCWNDGSPFFYLGDTAWELFHRLNREDADLYLTDRTAKGFTVIQAVILAEANGLKDPNPYGDLSLINSDPLQPNEAYFKHVDYIVNKAASLGLFIGMLPTWGDKWNNVNGTKKWGDGPEIFTPDNAQIYGKFLGTRYRDKPIIWILGGDRPVLNEQHKAILRAMAAGLKAGDEGKHLITMHASSNVCTSQYFHQDDWLDFNTIQSGHKIDCINVSRIRKDYLLIPAKPIMDMEPGYEHIPSGLQPKKPLLTEVHARRAAYWALFSGAHGHTYGCNEIWQMWQVPRQPRCSANMPWQEALKLPGSGQIQYARALVESRPYFPRIPDQSLLLTGPTERLDYVAVTSDKNEQNVATYIMAFLPKPSPITINTSVIADTTLKVWWYDPRLGTASSIGEVPNTKTYSPPPAPAPGDWVIVIESSAAHYPPPGTVAWRR